MSEIGIHYECVRCTECCRWPGLVELGDAEIARMAAHLGMGEREFIERYTRLRPDRRGLALQDAPGGACIFLDGRDCRVQPVKPQQCRDFPNGWNFPGFEKICRALPREGGESAGAQISAPSRPLPPTRRAACSRRRAARGR